MTRGEREGWLCGASKSAYDARRRAGNRNNRLIMHVPVRWRGRENWLSGRAAPSKSEVVK